MTRETIAFRSSAALVAVVAASGLVLQYLLLIGHAPAAGSVAFLTVRFFSYFTILSNLLVLLVTASAAVAAWSAWGLWFARPAVRGGVALYIGVTLGIYATVLQQLWQPEGAQRWADTALHYATPALYLAWWLWAVPHGALRRAYVAQWLLFPLAYLGWVFVRGAWVHEYPYPFLDIVAQGVPGVLANCAGVAALFLLLGAVLVVVDGWRGRSRAAVAAT
jgi:hypothetical protein